MTKTLFHICSGLYVPNHESNNNDNSKIQFIK